MVTYECSLRLYVLPSAAVMGLVLYYVLSWNINGLIIKKFKKDSEEVINLKLEEIYSIPVGHSESVCPPSQVGPAIFITRPPGLLATPLPLAERS